LPHLKLYFRVRQFAKSDERVCGKIHAAVVYSFTPPDELSAKGKNIPPAGGLPKLGLNWG